MWFTRLKEKLSDFVHRVSGDEDDLNWTRDNPSTLDPATLEQIASAPQTLAEEIWNEAYNKLKDEDGTLMETYEKIMTLRLQNRKLSRSKAKFASLENSIGDDISSRRRQMHELIHIGLEKTEQEAKVKKAIGETLKILNSAKDLIGTAVEGAPQAALPWAAVCLSLDILTNPVDQTAANRGGIKHVMNTMTWYSTLAECLLGNNEAGNELQGLRSEMKHQITNFYKELLEFEIKSIISYHRHRGVGFLRDIIKLDDWDGAFSEIRNTENILRDRIQQFDNAKLIADPRSADERRKDEECLRDLLVSDPRAEKDRIEKSKGGLYEESYSWILENQEYQTWVHDESKKLLWMRGDPGKGKTMLLCGIVNELRLVAAPHGLTYFFCQATVPKINKHVNVLRGLIWLLAEQMPRLISHVRKRYDMSGKGIFEDQNAWWTLSDIFRKMLSDAGSPFIAIDGLDECLTGLPELLELLKDLSMTTSAKWILSSRNWPEIESVLGPASSLCGMSLSLEVNAALVSKAVDVYISHRVDEISKFCDRELLERIADKIRERANGTFLWVAIVFQQLQESLKASFDEAQEVLEVLDGAHDDLSALYKLMLQKIERQKDRERDRCRSILVTATLAKRPMHIEELAAVEGFTGNLANVAELEKLVRKCGSFLTVRDDYIYFIHYSAKEFLVADEFALRTLFSEGKEASHYEISLKSLDCLEKSLWRNMYGLDEALTRSPGKSLTPDPDPHKALRYACDHWIDHVLDLNGSKRRDLSEAIVNFLTKHVLHWIEARILRGDAPREISVELGKLDEFAQRANESDFTWSGVQYSMSSVACRFLDLHEDLLLVAPLQIYSSAIVFSPRESLMWPCFRHLISSWISMEQPMLERRTPTIYREIDAPGLLAISNERFLRLKSECIVEVCDIVFGTSIESFETDRPILRASFSSDPDIIRLSTDRETFSRRVAAGVRTQSLIFDKSESDEIFFSDDGNIVALLLPRTFLGKTPRVRVKNLTSKTDQEVTLLHDPRNFEGLHPKVLVTNDGKFLAAIGPKGYHVYDLLSNTWWKQHFRGPFCFSSDCKLLASGTDHNSIQILDFLAKKEIYKEIVLWSNERFQVSRFSDDSRFWAGMDTSGLIQLWDIASRQLMFRWQGTFDYYLSRYIADTRKMDFLLSRDAQLFATTTSRQGRHWIWEMPTHQDPINSKPSMRQDGSSPGPMILSRDSRLLAFWRNGIHITNVKTGRKLLTIPHEAESELQNLSSLRLGFSRDSKMVFAIHPDLGLRRYEIAGQAVPLSNGSSGIIDSKHSVSSGSFSDTGRFASLDDDGICGTWHLNLIFQTPRTPDKLACRGLQGTKVTLSANGRYLAVQSDRCLFHVWDVVQDAEVWSFQCAYCANHFKEKSTCRCDLSVSVDGSAVLLKDPSEDNAIVYSSGLHPFAVFVGRYFPLKGRDDLGDLLIQTERGQVAFGKLYEEHLKPYDASRWRLKHEGFQIPLYHRPAKGYGIRRPDSESVESKDRYWLTWNEDKIMLLPEEFEPDMSRESNVVIWRDGLAYFTADGELCQYRFSGPPPGKAEIAEKVKEDFLHTLPRRVFQET